MNAFDASLDGNLVIRTDNIPDTHPGVRGSIDGSIEDSLCDPYYRNPGFVEVACSYLQRYIKEVLVSTSIGSSALAKA